MESIDNKAEEWAKYCWDESHLEESERTNERTISLCKSCGVIGYKQGYKEALSFIKEKFIDFIDNVKKDD